MLDETDTVVVSAEALSACWEAERSYHKEVNNILRQTRIPTYQGTQNLEQQQSKEAREGFIVSQTLRKTDQAAIRSCTG